MGALALDCSPSRVLALSIWMLTLSRVLMLSGPPPPHRPISATPSAHLHCPFGPSPPACLQQFYRVTTDGGEPRQYQRAREKSKKLVDFSWIEDCLAQKRLLSFDHYQVSDLKLAQDESDSKVTNPHQSRAHQCSLASPRSGNQSVPLSLAFPYPRLCVGLESVAAGARY